VKLQKDISHMMVMNHKTKLHPLTFKFSEYPRQLKGEKVSSKLVFLLFTMLWSHRPYHPSWGIEAALEKIDKNKGILYDNAVVNACFRLFREKNFYLT
jgi:response regulator RpfG family c-di-GMP phosphodiesterase